MTEAWVMSPNTFLQVEVDIDPSSNYWSLNFTTFQTPSFHIFQRVTEEISAALLQSWDAISTAFSEQ